MDACVRCGRGVDDRLSVRRGGRLGLSRTRRDQLTAGDARQHLVVERGRARPSSGAAAPAPPCRRARRRTSSSASAGCRHRRWRQSHGWSHVVPVDSSHPRDRQDAAGAAPFSTPDRTSLSFRSPRPPGWFPGPYLPNRTRAYLRSEVTTNAEGSNVLAGHWRIATRPGRGQVLPRNGCRGVDPGQGRVEDRVAATRQRGQRRCDRAEQYHRARRRLLRACGRLTSRNRRSRTSARRRCASAWSTPAAPRPSSGGRTHARGRGSAARRRNTRTRWPSVRRPESRPVRRTA